MTQNELIKTDIAEARRIIRDEFQNAGMSSMRDLWMRVKPLLPASVVASCEADGGMKLCREVMREKDETTGLATARPLGRDDGLWKRVPLFSAEEMNGLVIQLFKGVQADYNEAMKYRDYMVNKFGWAPPVPTLVLPDSSAVA